MHNVARAFFGCSVLASLLLSGCQNAQQKPVVSKDDALLTGKKRPPTIPANWIGEPLPEGKGWRWMDPDNRGNSVRIYRGEPDAENPVDRDTYVVVTVDGQLIGRNGERTGRYLRD